MVSKRKEKKRKGPRTNGDKEIDKSTEFKSKRTLQDGQ
jgi:hypothetical protein